MRRLIRDILWLIQARLTKKEKIVCFGTSLTEGSGWVKLLQKELPEYHVINFGKGGMNSNWGVDNLKWVLWFKPSIVLMEFAINDAYEKCPYYEPTTFGKSWWNIKGIFWRLEEKKIKVYYLGMNPPYDIFIAGRNPAKDRPEYRNFANRHKRLCEVHKIDYIDITSVWDRIDTTIVLKEYCPDGLHPTEKASREIIVPSILKGLSESRN